ncbi:MAG: hypothetical protein IJT05_09675 [Lachnospiraceae bacterium]|nr:hypothetical protein [Lachnospiraceae bacterium]
MKDEKTIGNAALVEAIREHGASKGVEHIPYVAAEIIKRIKEKGTLFVASKDLPFFFSEELQECWSIGFTSREECELDSCREYTEISWEELFQRIIDDPLLSGLLLNPHGARYPIPQELMKDILSAEADPTA